MSIAVAKQLEKGMTFFEHAYGHELELTVLTTPARNEDGQWTWKARSASGEEVNYLITEGYECYGPNITLERMYG